MSFEYKIKCWAKLTRPGAYYQLSRFDGNQFVQGDLIIPENRHVGSLKYLSTGET